MIMDYNVTEKQGKKDSRMKNSDVNEIKQYLRGDGGVYILTDKDLRFYKEGKDVDRTQFTLIADKKDLKKREKENFL